MYRKWTENGPTQHREWTDSLAPTFCRFGDDAVGQVGQLGQLCHAIFQMDKMDKMDKMDSANF